MRIFHDTRRWQRRAAWKRNLSRLCLSQHRRRIESQRAESSYIIVGFSDRSVNDENSRESFCGGSRAPKTHPRASTERPRRLAGNYSRAGLRITCRCLSVFNYYRRRSRMTGISRAGCHPGGEARTDGERRSRAGERRGRGPPREYARSRARTARRIHIHTHAPRRALLWHIRNKAHRHTLHPDTFDLAREASILGTLARRTARR